MSQSDLISFSTVHHGQCFVVKWCHPRLRTSKSGSWGAGGYGI